MQNGEGPGIPIGPVVDLSQLQRRPIAMLGTVLFSDGTAQQVYFLEADSQGLTINVGNIKQTVGGQGVQ